MKNIFLVLVLINIIYFMWTAMGPHAPSSQSKNPIPVKAEMSSNRIILVDEISGLAVADANPANEDKIKELNRFAAMQSTGSNLSDLGRAIVSKSIDNAVVMVISVNMENRTNDLLDQFEPDRLLSALRATTIVVNLVDQAPYNKGPLCYKIGPRQSRSPLRALAKGLNKRGYESEIASEILDVQTGYMVYFPAAENYLDSRKNMKLLRNKGVKDLWLFEKGESRGIISLGRFKVRGRAVTMKKQLDEKGINTIITAIYTKKNGYFLFFRWSGSTSEFKAVLENSKAGIGGLERLPLNKCS